MLFCCPSWEDGSGYETLFVVYGEGSIDVVADEGSVWRDAGGEYWEVEAVAEGGVGSPAFGGALALFDAVEPLDSCVLAAGRG